MKFKVELPLSEEENAVVQFMLKAKLLIVSQPLMPKELNYLKTVSKGFSIIQRDTKKAIWRA